MNEAMGQWGNGAMRQWNSLNEAVPKCNDRNETNVGVDHIGPIAAIPFSHSGIAAHPIAALPHSTTTSQ